MKIKYYKPAISSMALGCKAGSTSSTHAPTVPEYKATNGTSYTKLYLGYADSGSALKSVSNLQPYRLLTAYASAEVETNFDIDEYASPSSELSDLTIVKTETSTTYGNSYILEITNNGSAAATVNSFKFIRTLYTTGQNVSAECLMFVVYLDSPLTIAVGATKTVTVNFSFYNQ